MNKENCALKLVDEIIRYYDARSKKHQITYTVKMKTWEVFTAPTMLQPHIVTNQDHIIFMLV